MSAPGANGDFRERRLQRESAPGFRFAHPGYDEESMRLTVTTWNINSVRLRINLVARFIRAVQPDVLCLQETKCPDDAFPLKRFHKLGYEHVALNGQKGYHGVVVLTRLPFESKDVASYCGKTDCRHISVVLGERAGLRDPITLHNFYVPAGGDIPDPELNEKFRHKLSFLDEMCANETLRCNGSGRMILVGDLNVAPLEHDVWSHKQMLKVVSHTPIECEKLTAAQTTHGWVDAMRMHVPEPQKLYTWWSYRAAGNWEAADRGRRLDHIWVSPGLADRVSHIDIAKAYRRATRPSDHVPVTAVMEV
jgi:exodeoxyribonuclease-3